MHTLHIIGIFLIIALLMTGTVLVLKIMKLEDEIKAERNERRCEAVDSGAGTDTLD